MHLSLYPPLTQLPFTLSFHLPSNATLPPLIFTLSPNCLDSKFLHSLPYCLDPQFLPTYYTNFLTRYPHSFWTHNFFTNCSFLSSQISYCSTSCHVTYFPHLSLHKLNHCSTSSWPHLPLLLHLFYTCFHYSHHPTLSLHMPLSGNSFHITHSGSTLGRWILCCDI